jgi:hypothetical protein
MLLRSNVKLSKFAFRATHHQGKAIVKPPSGEAGDSLVAYEAASVLHTPEKAKCNRTPKSISHIGPFTVCEVGFIGGIVWVGFSFDFNVSCNGCARGMETAALSAVSPPRMFPQRRSNSTYGKDSCVFVTFPELRCATKHEIGRSREFARCRTHYQVPCLFLGVEPIWP